MGTGGSRWEPVGDGGSRREPVGAGLKPDEIGLVSEMAVRRKSVDVQL